MLALCNAAVIKALVVVAAYIAGAAPAPPAADANPASRVSVTIAVSADTVTAPAPQAPAKPAARRDRPVRITISDDGIQVGDKGAVTIEVDKDEVERLKRDVLDKVDHLPESLETLFGDELGDRRFSTVKGSDVVQLGSDVTIAENELVNGNVVTIGGDIRIEGKVTGDVAAIFGSVELGDGAIVNGEVVSIFGSVDRESGAVIRGETAVIGGGRHGLTYPLGHIGEGIFGGVGRVVAFIIAVILTLILLFFIPRRMENAAGTATGSFWSSFGMGALLFFGGLILVIILGIILAITIVGIPVAVLLALSYAALLGIGYSVSALAVGRFVVRKFRVEADSIYFHAVIGLLLLAILGIVASFMTVSPLLTPARFAIGALGKLFQFLAILVGVGAFLNSRAGSRLPAAPGATAPAAGPTVGA